MTQTRAYSYKDNVILIASIEIGKALLANIQELSMARNNRNEGYANNFINRVNNAMEQYLGLNKTEAQKKATEKVNEIHSSALKSVTFFKKQIEVDFDKAEAKQILDNLGIPSTLKALNNGDQEGMIQLLFAFKKGMTNELKQEITSKGMNPALIDGIINYTNQLKDAEVNQELLKTTTKEVSNEAVFAFNEIYSEAIGICKIASTFYQDNPLKKELFTFSKIVAKMTLIKKKQDEQVEE